MQITGEMVIRGFGSMVAADCWDIFKNAIKSADKNRKALNQNIETRIYQVTIDAINAVTYNKYKEQDILYDSAESILKGFESGGENSEAVKAGLKMLGLQATGDMCKEFLAALRHEICLEKNSDLYKKIVLLQQKQMGEEMQKGFKESNQNHRKTHEKLDYVIKS
ncbi:MAG: hypothetical protein J6C33_04500 [Lachnospiraceae bacterium]|nr:hypothetical protein [Lachnospiraceae bacterium]